ncbi:MAG: hypothetical protein M3R02_08040 [Chloroflexota bacterium]|nr:hypothetical protein [Chloroflexota bacterium]
MDRRFKRYTRRARGVVTRAHDEARRLDHPYLGAEHLLLAITCDGGCNAARVLVDLGAELTEVAESVEFLVHPGDEPFSGDPPHTPRLRAAVDLAEEEARSHGRTSIGTEDLLLGLLRQGENVAAKVLAQFGVTTGLVRDRVGDAGFADREREAEETGRRGNVLNCRIDDHDLGVIDALVEAGIHTTPSDAASWLIRAGIEANRPLVGRVNSVLTEMCRLRDEARDSGSA